MRAWPRFLLRSCGSLSCGEACVHLAVHVHCSLNTWLLISVRYSDPRRCTSSPLPNLAKTRWHQVFHPNLPRKQECLSLIIYRDWDFSNWFLIVSTRQSLIVLQCLHSPNSCKRTRLPAGYAPPPARPAQQPQPASFHWNCIWVPLRKENGITTENISQETCRMLSWAGNIFCHWIHPFVFNKISVAEVTGSQSNWICFSASIYSATQNRPSYCELAGTHGR